MFGHRKTLNLIIDDFPPPHLRGGGQIFLFPPQTSEKWGGTDLSPPTMLENGGGTGFFSPPILGKITKIPPSWVGAGLKIFRLRRAKQAKKPSPPPPMRGEFRKTPFYTAMGGFFSAPTHP